MNWINLSQDMVQWHPLRKGNVKSGYIKCRDYLSVW
jgi:hypothetical protein